MNIAVYEWIVYLVEALISGIFLLNMLKPMHRKIPHMILWCECVALVLVVTPAFTLVRVGVLVIAELLFCLLMFDDAWLRKLLVFLFKQSMVLVSALLSYAIYALLVDDTVSFITSCRDENCTYCLFYLLFLSITVSVVFQFTKERDNAAFLWTIGTQVVAAFGEALGILAVAVADGGAISTRGSWFVIVAVVCLAVANISIGLLAPYLLRRISLSNNIDFGKELSSMEYKYYELSVENEKRLRTIRHEIANQIQTMYALLQSGDSQRGMKLMDELKARYALVDQMVFCDNPVLNIIFSNKKNEAEKFHIDTQIHIKDDLGRLPITDYDLSTVICNLLDNAIRGCVCSEQSHPRLVVEVLKKNQYLVLRVLNSCRMNMNIEGADRIETTKDHTVTRGFGMPLIAGIAKKYRGDFVVSAQNGIFTATVVMSLKGE